MNIKTTNLIAAIYSGVLFIVFLCLNFHAPFIFTTDHHRRFIRVEVLYSFIAIGLIGMIFSFRRMSIALRLLLLTLGMLVVGFACGLDFIP